MIYPHFSGLFPAARGDGIPKAALPELCHDFGVVQRGEKVVHRFAARNEGSGTLTLERGELSAPGMDVRYRKTIPPGEEAGITVEWNTALLHGLQEAQIVLHCDDRRSGRFGWS